MFGSFINIAGERLIFGCLVTYVRLFCRYAFSEDQTVAEADWEVYLRETANMIGQEQSRKRFVETMSSVT